MVPELPLTHGAEPSSLMYSSRKRQTQIDGSHRVGFWVLLGLISSKFYPY